jgi:hypothetical protein
MRRPLVSLYLSFTNELPLPAYAVLAYACHWQAVGALQGYRLLQIHDPEA